MQGFGHAVGAILMDLKKATTVASITVMTFMLAGGFFVAVSIFLYRNHTFLLTYQFLHIYISPILQKVPDFIVWLRYLSFNYHTYKLLLKVQYGHMIHSVNGIEIDNGVKEVSVLAAMIFGYRFLAYLSLRRMKLGS